LKRVDNVFHIWDLPSCQVQQTITNLKQEKHHNQLQAITEVTENKNCTPIQLVKCSVSWLEIIGGLEHIDNKRMSTPGTTRFKKDQKLNRGLRARHHRNNIQNAIFFCS
jgi:hypothetical protein